MVSSFISHHPSFHHVSTESLFLGDPAKSQLQWKSKMEAFVSSLIFNGYCEVKFMRNTNGLIF